MQLNPLLSPSLNFVKERCSEFFYSKEKYLIFENDLKVVEKIKAEGLNPADFVLFREGYYERGKGLPRGYIDEGVIRSLTSFGRTFCKTKRFARFTSLNPLLLFFPEDLRLSISSHLG